MKPQITQISREIEAALEAIRRVTVQVRTRGAGMGAGVVWERGLVITNAHVVHGERATIVLSDGSSARARVVARDEERDLAALQFDAANGDDADDEVEARQAVPLQNRTTPLRVGELVIALGHPGGLVDSATLGIVHASASPPDPVSKSSPPDPLSTDVERGNDKRTNGPQWVYADIRLAPGFSGGPLVDAQGRLVGINTMVNRGLALAIPTAAIEEWVRETTSAPARP